MVDEKIIMILPFSTADSDIHRGRAIEKYGRDVVFNKNATDFESCFETIYGRKYTEKLNELFNNALGKQYYFDFWVADESRERVSELSCDIIIVNVENDFYVSILKELLFSYPEEFNNLSEKYKNNGHGHYGGVKKIIQKTKEPNPNIEDIMESKNSFYMRMVLRIYLDIKYGEDWENEVAKEINKP